MDGKYLNKLLRIEAKHALYHESGKWYHNLKKFPGVLFDKNGYIVFQNEKLYSSHRYLQSNKDLFIKDGIESLDEYRKFTAFEQRLIIGIDSQDTIKDSFEETVRVLREVNTILRKKPLVDRLKKLYDNTCQICGTKIALGNKRFYSEAHHIVPLGKPYNGKDRLDNMICVCPNHHVQLDLKAIRLERNSLKLKRHELSNDFINHHNSLFNVKNGI
ncbi:5-methylcytosine-specific restriction enzyme A [Reichenbachiella faecimaris]|uniref:5-methylcytosine-specific restriction enzyme A n=1 Tax=Reichenbachiella faecimaris TaxID=692418 RepID=A0A1W2GLY2_REIFA|nr:HNH endonuclease [Reichenbachiella faecimaris]SMD37660.1 5-methylcytosine-specific restriction enzyme A [Reichenbachiella faecimaris]